MPVESALQEPLTNPYPPGRWRLAPVEDLGEVVLWVSHILIRHQGVPSGSISFNLGDWSVAPPAPERTREAAFELAQQVAARVQEKPEDFASVARELSEDVTTRGDGGSLGGICASELYRWHANVLDAFAEVDVGEVSRVVESPYGFHVFLRRQAPPEEHVSGSRIVIGYEQAPWLSSFLARGEISSRSRPEALARAQSVYKLASSGETFEKLVDEYSDHRDALLKGDFGEWSTRQCTPYPREVEVLQGLRVGAVSRPLDTRFGVQIIKRTPNRVRQTYAMASVQQRFDFTQAGNDAASRRAVRKNVEALSQELAAHPERFESLQNEYCCKDVEQWIEGQGPPAAEQALAQLLPGDIGPMPVDLGTTYAIVRRTTPTLQAPRDFKIELPSPQKVDLHDRARRALMNYQLRSVGRRAEAALNLTGEFASRFLQLHDEEGAVEYGTEAEDQRDAHFAAFLERVGTMLGSERYAMYLDVMSTHFEELLLEPRERRKAPVGAAARP